MFKIDYKTRDLERENQRQDLYWFNHQKDLHPVDLINTRPSTIELLSYKHYIHLLPIALNFPDYTRLFHSILTCKIGFL